MTERISPHKYNPAPQLALAAKPKNPAPVVHHTTASGGQTLDAKTQREMGSRFGHDFSQVRIHTDTRAAESAQAVGANAYAVGSDIVFGSGAYAPGSVDGDRLLAHELTHVVQQSSLGGGDWGRMSQRNDASEREADTLAAQVMEGQTVQVQCAPRAAIAREEEEKGGFLNSLVSGVSGAASSLASGTGSVLKTGWEGTKTVTGAAYNGYENMTNFKPLQGGLNSGVDWVEKQAAVGNQKMVDDSKGHWYEGLAQGTAWMNNGMTQVTGGITKGVGDLGFGIANGLAHPIDAVAGIEGILEHNMTVPGLGTTLKAGHALYDLAAKDDPKDRQYGSSVGDIASHLFDPRQQAKDDINFDANLAAGIIAPDKDKEGHTDWSAWKNKPAEAAARAATNIVPFFLGMGEADAAKAGDIATAAEAGDAAQASKGSHTPTLPGIGPDLPPPTERGMPTIPGVQPGRTPTIPGMELPPTLPEPTLPSPVSPKATTVEAPTPVSPKATTVEMPGNVDPLGKTEVNPLGKTDPAPSGFGETPSSPIKTKNPVQQMTAVDPAQAGGPQPPGFQSGPVTAGKMPYNPNVVAINPAEVENALAAAAKGEPLPEVATHGAFEPFEGRGPSSQPGWLSNRKTLPGIGPEPIEPQPVTLDSPSRVDPLGRTGVDPFGKTDPSIQAPGGTIIDPEPLTLRRPSISAPGEAPEPVTERSPVRNPGLGEPPGPMTELDLVTQLGLGNPGSVRNLLSAPGAGEELSRR